jgi:predicted DNA-binding transcriptional regulator AlpA
MESTWLNYEAVAKRTGYSSAYLRTLQFYGHLPESYGAGRARRWKAADIDTWMQSANRKKISAAMTRVRESMRRRASRKARAN